MCSIEELGSSKDMYPNAPESGIYIMPEDAEVGADAVKALGLDDVVFEYEITSNRVDCFSVVALPGKRQLPSAKSSIRRLSLLPEKARM